MIFPQGFAILTCRHEFDSSLLYSPNLVHIERRRSNQKTGETTPALTMALAETKNNFSRVTAEVNRTRRPVTVLKNNKPWVVIQPATTPAAADAVDVAIDFIDDYADVFAEFAK